MSGQLHQLARSRQVITVPLDELVDGEGQPRSAISEDRVAEIAKSIDAHGQLQPIVVTRSGRKWAVQAGRVRVAALRLLGHHSVEAVESGPLSARAQVAENTGREPLSSTDLLAAIEAAAADGLPTEDIAAEFGIGERTVRRYRRIGADPELAARLQAGETLRSIDQAAREPAAEARRSASRRSGRSRRHPGASAVERLERAAGALAARAEILTAGQRRTVARIATEVLDLVGADS